MKKQMISILSSLLLLTGCSGAKKSLGLTRNSPDEFAVVKRAPLEMPPDYALRPPQPGAPRPQEQAAADQARAAVLGGRGGGKSASPAESSLVHAAGGAQISGDIRKKVDAESSDEGDVPVVKKLIGIGGDERGEGKTIDPAQEAARLKAQKSAEEKR